MPFLPVNPPLRSCVFVVFSFVHFLSQLFLSVVVLEINSLLSQYITHAILVRPVFYCPYSTTQSWVGPETSTSTFSTRP